jgi:DNA-directed RNA polymerase specialized sigma24 family protein
VRPNDPIPGQGSIRRLTRFALCVAPSSTAATDALEALPPFREMPDCAEGSEWAFRALLERFDFHDPEEPMSSDAGPRSFVARFSCLPFHERVAFALVVIEEFSTEEAARIMGVHETALRTLLMSSREFLFANRGTIRADA